ncbi:hypothetical protein ACP70R_031218 [Stipagrostis hirtigluma subsp. patula]
MLCRQHRLRQRRRRSSRTKRGRQPRRSHGTDGRDEDHDQRDAEVDGVLSGRPSHGAERAAAIEADEARMVGLDDAPPDNLVAQAHVAGLDDAAPPDSLAAQAHVAGRRRTRRRRTAGQPRGAGARGWTTPHCPDGGVVARSNGRSLAAQSHAVATQPTDKAVPR